MLRWLCRTSQPSLLSFEATSTELALPKQTLVIIALPKSTLVIIALPKLTLVIRTVSFS